MPDGMLGYCLGKIEAEKALFGQEVVPYTIIRPPAVMGPENHFGWSQFYFQRLLDGKPLILTNGGLQSRQPVYRRDLAWGYMLAMGSEKAVNQVYNIAQEKSMRLVDWVRLAADLLGVTPNLVPIPLRDLQQASWQYAEDWVNIGTILVNISKARDDLGYASTPVATWLAETTRWYQETEHKADSAVTAIDRSRLSSLSAI